MLQNMAVMQCLFGLKKIPQAVLAKLLVPALFSSKPHPWSTIEGQSLKRFVLGKIGHGEKK